MTDALLTPPPACRRPPVAFLALQGGDVGANINVGEADVWHICETVFTARRYAKRGICRRRVSVCLSVCLSVTLRYCVKTAKRRIMQIMPHDSHMTLVF